MVWLSIGIYLESVVDVKCLSGLKTLLLSLAALQCVDDKAPCVNNATCLKFSNGTEYCR